MFSNTLVKISSAKSEEILSKWRKFLSTTFFADAFTDKVTKHTK